MSSDEDLVFKALADRTRRRILDLIRDEPLTTGALCLMLEPLDRCTVMLLSLIHIYVAKLVGNDLSLFMGTMDAEGIAMLRQMKESPEMAQWASMMPDFNRFRPGTRTRLDLKFVLSQPFGGRALINGTQMSGDASGVPYDRLPRPFLDAIKKAEDAYRQLMQGAGEGPVVPTEQPGTKP